MPEQNQPPVDSILNFIKTKFKQLDITSATTFLSKFCQYSICYAVLVYFVGTVILLLRNLNSQIPFIPLSIIQTTIITIYFVIIEGGFILLERVIHSLWSYMKQLESKTKRIKLAIKTIAIVFIINAITAGILSIFFHSFILSALLIFTFYLLPTFCIHITKNWFKPPLKSAFITFVWTSIISASFITLLPASVGGLSSQKVIYYNNNSTICQEYDYYGVTDNMMILKNDDAISLIPVGSGRLEYRTKLTKDAPKCGTLTDSASPANSEVKPQSTSRSSSSIPD